MSGNNLDLIMKEEALSSAELARFAILSEKTVGKVRGKKTKPSLGTINKIVRGLNENPKKLKPYTETDVFPFSGV